SRILAVLLIGLHLLRSILGIEVVIPDSSLVYPGTGMVESKSVGTISPVQRQDSHRGLFVDRGVGSPRLTKSLS
ncbi:hypothetical protein LINGRAPRIM_LOCUS1884, partial [Linum grandiflorum]